MQFLIIIYYAGNTIILSSRDPTTSYFNIDYSALNELRDNMMAVAGTGGTPILLPSKKQFVSIADNAVKKTIIEDILEAEVAKGEVVNAMDKYN